MKRFLFVAVLLSFAAPAAAGDRQLSQGEVNSLIIDRECKLTGTNEKFVFQRNGKYQFRRGAEKAGPYDWSWGTEGVIRGETTEFTFFASGRRLAYNNTKGPEDRRIPIKCS